MSGLTRRKVLKVTAAAVSAPLVGCRRAVITDARGTTLDVVLYSFVDRPIFDIFLNGTHVGVADPYGGTPVINGVGIPFGRQKLTWRLDGPEGTARNGDTVSLRNEILISADQIPGGTRHMGVYLYPDDTAEMSFSKHIPDNSKRGEEILRSAKAKQ